MIIVGVAALLAGCGSQPPPTSATARGTRPRARPTAARPRLGARLAERCEARDSNRGLNVTLAGEIDWLLPLVVAVCYAGLVKSTDDVEQSALATGFVAAIFPPAAVA